MLQFPSPLGISILSASRRAPANIVCTGNSTTSVTNGNWPAQFATLRAPWGDVITNSGVDGQSTQYLIDNFASLFTAFKSTSKRNEIIFFEGANYIDANFNDGFGHSFGLGITNIATFYAKTVEFCTLARLNGWLVRVMTLDRWIDIDYNKAAFYAAFDSYNTYVRAGTADFDGLIDLNATGAFDPDNDPTPYYIHNGNGARIHKTAAGITKTAQVVATLYGNVVGV